MAYFRKSSRCCTQQSDQYMVDARNTQIEGPPQTTKASDKQPTSARAQPEQALPHLNTRTRYPKATCASIRRLSAESLPTTGLHKLTKGQADSPGYAGQATTNCRPSTRFQHFTVARHSQTRAHIPGTALMRHVCQPDACPSYQQAGNVCRRPSGDNENLRATTGSTKRQ